MNKASYRALFLDMMRIIKLNPFLKELRIPQANFSHFIHGYDWCISIEKLNDLYTAVQNELKKFA